MVCRCIASFDTEDKAVASPKASNASASEPLTEIQQPFFLRKFCIFVGPTLCIQMCQYCSELLRPTGAEAPQNSSGGGAMEFSSCWIGLTYFESRQPLCNGKQLRFMTGNSTVSTVNSTAASTSTNTSNASNATTAVQGPVQFAASGF